MVILTIIQKMLVKTFQDIYIVDINVDYVYEQHAKPNSKHARVKKNEGKKRLNLCKT